MVGGERHLANLVGSLKLVKRRGKLKKIWSDVQRRESLVGEIVRCRVRHGVESKCCLSPPIGLAVDDAPEFYGQPGLNFQLLKAFLRDIPDGLDQLLDCHGATSASSSCGA